MARTVEDAVRVLDAIAGYDPADPITERSEGQRPASYLASLDKDGLRGVRLGLLRRYVDTPTTDPEIRALTDRALQDLRRLGAEVVDPIDIPDYLELIDNIWCDRFQHDVNGYLATLGKAAPYATIAAVFESGLYAPYVEPRLKNALEVKVAPEAMDPPCLDVYQDARNIAFRDAVLAA